MLVIGLTGGIGAGKSTVASLFGAHGALVIDVDALGRDVLDRGGPAEAAVAARFGPVIVGADGAIDRAALAKVVFGDATALADLTAISHPTINVLLEERIADAAGAAQVVVLDMAVLTESRLGYRADGTRLYDKVVVVEARWDVRLARLIERGMTTDEAVIRRDAQASDDERRAIADTVIVNDRDRARLSVEVDRVWDELVSGDRTDRR